MEEIDGKGKQNNEMKGRGEKTMTLAELPIGQEGEIAAVGGEEHFRCRLLDMGLLPKTKVKVLKTAPMGDPIQIHLRGYDLTLRKKEAEKILLEESL